MQCHLRSTLLPIKTVRIAFLWLENTEHTVLASGKIHVRPVLVGSQPMDRSCILGLIDEARGLPVY